MFGTTNTTTSAATAAAAAAAAAAIQVTVPRAMRGAATRAITCNWHAELALQSTSAMRRTNSL